MGPCFEPLQVKMESRTAVSGAWGGSVATGVGCRHAGACAVKGKSGFCLAL